jgi:hypothetical protein
MNHLNVLAGTHSGLTGIVGVSGIPAGLTCGEEAFLADVGVSLAGWLGTAFPQSVGHVLTCTPR